MRYELEKVYDGYIIHDKKRGGKFGLYMTFCRNGVYHWSSDLTYAGHYSGKTALKHMETLITGKERKR